MPLTTAEQVRLRIQDNYRYHDQTLYGDATATRYVLNHNNIQSATAYVSPGGTAWSATGGVTFNASGYVDFTDRISALSAFRVVYHWSVFSDNEIGHFTAVGGNVPGAALEAVRTLQFDSLKRARWMSPDGAQFDDTAALAQLRFMESALKVEVEEAGQNVTIYNWSETQGDFG